MYRIFTTLLKRDRTFYCASQQTQTKDFFLIRQLSWRSFLVWCLKWKKYLIFMSWYSHKKFILQAGYPSKSTSWSTSVSSHPESTSIPSLGSVTIISNLNLNFAFICSNIAVVRIVLFVKINLSSFWRVIFICHRIIAWVGVVDI